MVSLLGKLEFAGTAKLHISWHVLARPGTSRHVPTLGEPPSLPSSTPILDLFAPTRGELEGPVAVAEVAERCRQPAGAAARAMPIVSRGWPPRPPSDRSPRCDARGGTRPCARCEFLSKQVEHRGITGQLEEEFTPVVPGRDGGVLGE